MRSGTAFVGTSGWIYKHWRETFYPAGVPERCWLAYLSERFSTVEINGTFYSLKRPNCFALWREQVGPGFTFAVKASRYVTHMLKLGGGAAPLGNFFAQGLLLLGEQLGPILWQLPPMLRFTRERAAPFFDALPRDLSQAEKLARKHDARLNGRSVLTAPDGRHHRIRHALEVRHESWLCEEALALYHEHEIALVTADTAGKFSKSIHRTAPFAYVRLHGAEQLYASRYTDAELDHWAALVGGWLGRGSDVYVYFDNDNKAYAPGDALRLCQRLQGGAHAEHQGHHRGVQRSDSLRP